MEKDITKNENVYEKLAINLKTENKMALLTKITKLSATSEKAIEKKALNFAELELNEWNINEEAMRKAKETFKSGVPLFLTLNEYEKILIEPFFKESRLIILGGGHIAKPLVRFGTEIGFSVTVADDRLSFSNQLRFPEANLCICESFEKSIDLLKINAMDYVILVTRGHRHDKDCLRQLLNKETYYLGMIGSKRRVKIIRAELIDEGFVKEQVDKICAPIGLDIGAVTPEEIAISIIAQVISKKRLNKTSNLDNEKKLIYQNDFDHQVIEELAGKDETKIAVVTVISTKGSVPRKAGAKMIVWEDGRTLGSIGGGCSEAEIVNVAQYRIDKGGYQINEIDMTGEIAEENGMVCGGVMQVLIEAQY